MGKKVPHKHLASAEAVNAGPWRLGFADAQEWANFVVLQPSWLPSGCRIERGEMRPETPPRDEEQRRQPGRSPWTLANPSAYRFELVGAARRLRIKQFLYDWAPPAADHPCLWGSRPIAFTLRNAFAVGWIGEDYKKNRAASARIHRTMTELSVLEGAFADEEIQEIFHGLSPAVPAAIAEISQYSFASLSYWARYQPPLIVVPYGLFYYRDPDPLLPYVWSADSAWLSRLPDLPPGPSPSTGYRFDSLCVHGRPEAPHAVELIYVRANERNHHLHFIAARAGPGSRIEIPPRVDQHPCHTEEIQRCGTPVWHAFVSEQFGPHEAVVVKNDVSFMLVCSAAPDTNIAWFRGLADDLLASRA